MTKLNPVLTFFTVVLFASISSATGSDDKATQEALQKTVELLRSPTLRQEAIIKDGVNAQNADAQVRALGTDADTQAIYELAADVFAKMIKDANGDINKVKELLNSSPEAVANTFSEEQKRRLKSIAESIEAQRAPSTR